MHGGVGDGGVEDRVDRDDAFLLALRRAARGNNCRPSHKWAGNSRHHRPVTCRVVEFAPEMPIASRRWQDRHRTTATAPQVSAAVVGGEEDARLFASVYSFDLRGHNEGFWDMVRPHEGVVHVPHSVEMRCGLPPTGTIHRRNSVGRGIA